MISGIIINEVIRDWCDECGIPYTSVMFRKLWQNPGEIEVFTDRPGWLIGKAGVMLNKYTEKLQEKINKYKGNEIISIKIIETERVISIKEEEDNIAAAVWKLKMCDENF